MNVIAVHLKLGDFKVFQKALSPSQNSLAFGVNAPLVFTASEMTTGGKRDVRKPSVDLRRANHTD